MAPTSNAKKNPLDLIKSNAGTPMRRGGTTAGVNTDILNRKIAAILGSNAPNSAKKSVLKQAPTAPKEESWWEQGLNVLGKPNG